MQSSAGEQSTACNQNCTIDGEYLDAEFNRYAQMAHDLMQNMKSSEDRRICARYIEQCNKMKSENIGIKFHRNRFFRFLLRTMKRTVDDQIIQKDYHFNLVRKFKI